MFVIYFQISIVLILTKETSFFFAKESITEKHNQSEHRAVENNGHDYKTTLIAKAKESSRKISKFTVRLCLLGISETHTHTRNN